MKGNNYALGIEYTSKVRSFFIEWPFYKFIIGSFFIYLIPVCMSAYIASIWFSTAGQFEKHNNQIFAQHNSNNRPLGPGKTGQFISRENLQLDDDASNQSTFHQNQIVPIGPQTSKWYLMIFLASLLILFYGVFHFRLIQKIKSGNRMIKQKERLEKIKSKFLANISHEQRTPLSLILNALNHVLSKANLSEENQSQILQALKNTGKLSELTDKIMDLSMLEENQLSLSHSSVEISEELERIYTIFQPKAALKHIDFRISNLLYAKTWLSLDIDKLETILSNLINNALKYTNDGGEVVLILDVTNQPKELKIVVKDNGKGIRERDKDHLFERYYQSTDVEKDNEGGVGIGLALAYELTQLLGGQLEVKSQWGQGSVFALTIPVDQIDPPDLVRHQDNRVLIEEVMHVEESNHTAKEETIKAKRSDRILIVEDNDDMRCYLEKILAPIYQLVSVSNGQQALDFLYQGQEKIDLIVTDALMPVLDGFGLLDAVRKSEQFSTLPVIMLTGLTGSDDKVKALLIGVDDYLTKPFSDEELLARCANLLERLVVPESSHEEVTADEDKDASPEHLVTQADLKWLKEVEEILVKEISNPQYNMSQLAFALALSERQTRRRIKKITGMSSSQYFREIRLNMSIQLLETGKYRSIAEVSYKVGFETPGYFSKIFRERFGKEAGNYVYD